MKYQRIKILIDSPYKWGQGWTSTKNELDNFNDNLMAIVSELDMDINLSTHGVVQGNEFGTIPSAYMHPMELCFNIEYNNDEIILSENVANIVNIIKKYSKGFYTVNKVISKSDFI